jgi:hypothetical protein
MAECAEREPPLAAVEGRLVACHLYEQAAAGLPAELSPPPVLDRAAVS